MPLLNQLYDIKEINIHFRSYCIYISDLNKILCTLDKCMSIIASEVLFSEYGLITDKIVMMLNYYFPVYTTRFGSSSVITD